MSKGTNNSGGWLDWQVVLAMILFVVLILCYVYSGSNILKYIAIVPAIYGVVRTFASAMER